MPKAPNAPGFGRFEFKPGVNQFPKWEGINRSGDPSAINPHQLWTAENVRVVPKGIISRGGMTQQADFSTLFSGSYVTGLYDTAYADNNISSGQDDDPVVGFALIGTHTGYKNALLNISAGDATAYESNYINTRIPIMLYTPNAPFATSGDFSENPLIWDQLNSTSGIPSGAKLFGPTTHRSFISTKFSGKLLGACCEDSTLKLIEWAVTGHTFKPDAGFTNVVDKFGTVSQRVIATVGLTSPDIPGAFWGTFTENNIPVVYFGMMKSGKLFKWDGTTLTLDGTPGAGLDLVINYNGSMVLVGRDYIKVRASAGSYGSNLLPTGAGITVATFTAETYGAGGFSYAKRSGAPTGDINLATHRWIPTCFTIFDNNLYIGATITETTTSTNTLYGTIYKYTGSGNASLFHTATVGTPSAASKWGYGILGLSWGYYSFTDMTTTGGSAASAAGNKLFWLSNANGTGISSVTRGVGVMDPQASNAISEGRLGVNTGTLFGVVGSGDDNRWPCGQLYQLGQGLVFSAGLENPSAPDFNSLTYIRLDSQWISPSLAVATSVSRNLGRFADSTLDFCSRLLL